MPLDISSFFIPFVQGLLGGGSIPTKGASGIPGAQYDVPAAVQPFNWRAGLGRGLQAGAMGLLGRGLGIDLNAMQRPSNKEDFFWKIIIPSLLQPRRQLW